MDLKNIAWDGISFNIPAKFEISGIDNKFLQLDNGEQPCIEIRWYNAGNKFNEKTYFRQLAKKVENTSGIKIESTVLPTSWKTPLKKYNSTAFYWQSDLMSGRGVMFYCKASKQVMLVQFISKCDDSIDQAAVDFFETLKFHNTEEKTPWSVYDIRTILPTSFTLDSFEFKPGKFNITFTDNNETLTFYRLGPGNIILKDTSLGDLSKKLFAEDIKKLKLSIAELDYGSGATCMFGQEKKPSSTTLALSKLNTKRRPYGQIEIRYTQESNRILAVKVCSRQPIPENRAKQLFEYYEIIS